MISQIDEIGRYRRSSRWTISWIFFASAIICLWFADIHISSLDPWAELRRMANGLLTPSLSGQYEIVDALLQTVAFALLGVAFGAVTGFALALVFHWAVVRIVCALLRSIHEIFWALIFLQIFGLHPLTGLLALGIPYAATFAKIYAEILDEGDPKALKAIKTNTNSFSAFFYARLPDLWHQFTTYTAYRLECGLRASAVLGFIGLPTLGYSLSTVFLEGQYSQVFAILIIFYVLIASMRFWLRPPLLPVYLIVAPFIVSNDSTISLQNVRRFFTEDVIPTPILNGESSISVLQWFSKLLVDQAWPGIVNTLVLSQIALVATGVIALIMFPLISKQFLGPVGRAIGHGILVVLRSTPEYMLAFILLLLWGPSMLPAIVALALHNGAVIAHLIGRFSNQLSQRQDGPTGFNAYGYDALPRVYGQFLVLLFYRWEVIFRETAILGILGIATLGFYIDSAIQDIRFDRALVLIVITGIINLLIDVLSRHIRSRLRLKTNFKVT